MEESETPPRVKFYGPLDAPNVWASAEAVALIQEYYSGREIDSLDDVLELYNALAFEENRILPRSFDQQELEKLESSARDLRGQLASFFASLTSSNVGQVLGEFEYEYAEDLITLLNRHDVAKKIGGQALFEALVEAQIPLGIMLSNRQFVKQHDRRLRDALLADPRNGELLVGQRMIKNSSNSYTFPSRFTSRDSAQLLSAYIESASPHPNYVQAIAEANDKEDFGLTPKIRLQAKKRHAELIQELFANEDTTLMNNGYGVRIAPEQRQPVIECVDSNVSGMTHVRSFGGQYLSSTLEPEQILSNFVTVVGYLDRQGLLTMPSFSAQIGALQVLFVTGKETYPRRQAFMRMDALTAEGTHAYSNFLHHNGVEIEDTVSWFFRKYLVDQFGAKNFYYSASSPGSSFLERCRHISAEMESISRKFTLYCAEDELDPELLRMTSSPKPWGEIPSLVEHKYVQRRTNSDCRRALDLLFRDQSGLTYINQGLRARSFVNLVIENQVRYDVLRNYQQERVDWMVSEGLVSVNTGQIEFSNLDLISVLGDIHYREAGPYGHYGAGRQAAALSLVEKGWLEFNPTLLTSAEASYFNFFLNKSEFSDGPDLRNRYAHGTNADPEDVAAHKEAYITLLRLLLSLVLKINDDFQLMAAKQ
ncbi:hypothetical protein [Arthrobacter livingstonensis]|uniref:hypothetical protein n=1 Tax=Arthrobacter livingstonensis TaxID=670078 RepID=UPI001B868165|nr:hypothetical protein [Arthrobacter livingstonensis]